MNVGTSGMWKLSDNVLKIVQKLYELSRSKSWFGGSGRESIIVALLERLGAAKEPAAIPCAAGYLVSKHVDVRNAASTTLDSLVSLLSPYDLIHLSDRFDWSCGWYVSDEWDKLRPTDVDALAGDSEREGHCAVLGLLCCHGNGFVRHAAVRRLSERFDGRELPFLVIRQNDWVEPIALAAQSAVAARVNDSYAGHLAYCLRLILHLATYQRRDHRAVVNRIVDLLLEERHDDLLRNIIQHGEREVRRHVIRYGLARPGDQSARLVALGIESDDPVVRVQCCRYLPVVCADDRLRSTLDKLASDSFPPVRREVLRIRAECFPDRAFEVWKSALVDESRSIRELGRFSLAQLGHAETDAAAVYRDLLAKDADSLPALEGLTETGDSSEIGYFQQLLNHGLASRRTAAIRGLIRIGKETIVPLILPLLKDESPRVVREVRKAIYPYRHEVSGSELLRVALDAKDLYARSNAVSLLAEFGKWRSIPWLLKVIAGADKETAKYAEQMIQEWMTPPKWNKDFTRLTEQDRRDIQRALSTPAARASPATIKLVEDGLRVDRENM